ncbi:MAG: hypothetical protein WAQ28_21035 [Bacteroidia bacterium]
MTLKRSYKDFSEKKIQEIKKALEKGCGREVTSKEAHQALGILYMFIEHSKDIVDEENRKQELLKKHPKGYYYDRKEGNCLVCGKIASEENFWFDKYGLKCAKCQKAINTKVIPVSVIKNKESWYSKDELDEYFNINQVELKRYIKQGLLIAHTVFGEKKKIHFQLFLIKDNKDVLPPKKNLKSKMGVIIRNDEEYYTKQYWYEFIDQKKLKSLMKYKIMQCLKETFAKPIERGTFLMKVKDVNPLFTVKK